MIYRTLNKDLPKLKIMIIYLIIIFTQTFVSQRLILKHHILHLYVMNPEVGV